MANTRWQSNNKVEEKTKEMTDELDSSKCLSSSTLSFVRTKWWCDWWYWSVYLSFVRRDFFLMRPTAATSIINQSWSQSSFLVTSSSLFLFATSPQQNSITECILVSHVYHWYTKYCFICLGMLNVSNVSCVKFSFPTCCRIVRRHMSISGNGSAVNRKK
jgi:hypothetical protein